jgi:hypothetical protein
MEVTLIPAPAPAYLQTPPPDSTLIPNLADEGSSTVTNQQVLQYLDTLSASQVPAPPNPSLPAVAYGQGGTGATLTWNTTTQSWQ